MNISINDITGALSEAGRGLAEQEAWNRWAVDMACVLSIDLLAIQRLPAHDVFPVLRSQIKEAVSKLVDAAAHLDEKLNTLAQKQQSPRKRSQRTRNRPRRTSFKRAK